MASASCLLSEDQFLCSICLEVFTDPVSIPCGHNFCKNCISQLWEINQSYQCPLCKELLYRGTTLRVNTILAEMVEQFKKKTGNSEHNQAKEGDVLCDDCSETKVKALKSCLICLTSYCEAHLEPHHRIPNLKRHKLVDPVENLEIRKCKNHNGLLVLFCRTDQTCVCLSCSDSNHKLHHMVPLMEEYKDRKAELQEAETEIQQMIEERQLKIQPLHNSVKLSRKNADRQMATSVQIFATLIQNIKNNQAWLLDLIEDKHKTTKDQAEGFISELEGEISELEKRHGEVKELLRQEDHLKFLNKLPSLNITPPFNECLEVRVHPSYEETVRTVVAQLEEKLNEEVKNLCLNLMMKSIQQHTVDIILNPDTAHPALLVSDDGKQVSHSDVKQDLPDSPSRFFKDAYVLGVPSVSSGKLYFEVQVKDKTRWELGVAAESVDRKGKVKPSRETGFFTLCMKNKNRCFSPGSSFQIHLETRPQKVGVFVDYEAGLVAFYDVDTGAQVFSYVGFKFGERLHPILRPGWTDGRENAAPLIISQVDQSSVV